MTEALIAILALLAGLGAGYLIRQQMSNTRANSAEAKAEKRLAEAELEAQQMIRTSTAVGMDEVESIRRKAAEDAEARREELSRREQGLDQRDQAVEAKAQSIDRRVAEGEELKATLRKEVDEVERRLVDLGEERQLLDAAVSVQRRELERAGIPP